MASSQQQRTVHQDYIARVRYSNVLPPPPLPPKLLHIPGTGLNKERHTSAAYASRLLREQPLNIEADAELGMPIDLIGLPGVFDGDESCMFGMENPPPAHPDDKLLLRPITAFSKTAAPTTSNAFTTRSEKPTVDPTRARLDSANANRLRSTNFFDSRKRKRTDGDKANDPVQTMRDIAKGFDIAYPEDAGKMPGVTGTQPANSEKKAWNQPLHPTNSSLKVVDSYPLIPDLEGISDSNSYIVTRFATNPTNASTVYDKRLDHAILRPLPLKPAVQAIFDEERAAHEEDSSLPPPKHPAHDFEYFLPDDTGMLGVVNQRFDLTNADRDDDGLYTEEDDEGKKYFKYSRVRAYDNQGQHGDMNNPFDEMVVFALNDEEGDDTSDAEAGDSKRVKRQKAAYVYPIAFRMQLRPKRLEQRQQEDERVDILRISVRDQGELELGKRKEFLEELYEPLAGAGEDGAPGATAGTATVVPDGAANGEEEP